jgi:phosphatidylserine/phosphatidylglycerophosphate/cardiolipin synthase-like enzyme
MKLSRLTYWIVACGLLHFLDSNVLSLIENNALANVQNLQRFTTGFFENSKNPRVVQLIDQAQHSLDIEIYEMDDPTVISSIRKALSRGVVVSIVKEPKPVGASCKVFEAFDTSTLSRTTARAPGSASCEDQQQLVTEVNEAGGKYVPFTKPDLCGGSGTKSCLEHGKVLIVDSKAALISSGNFNTTNLCDLKYGPKSCNRDYSYVTDDAEIVGTLQDIVEKDLIGKSYDVESVMSRSASKKNHCPNSLNPLLALIESAQELIQVENQYLKDPTLNAALIDAAKNGVEVQVTVASACSFGKPKPNEMKRLTAIFKAFDQAGIKTRMFTKNILVNGKPGYLHSKAILVDGKRAWMGSVNGSTQALTLNREFGIFFNDPKEIRKIESVLTEDFNNPNTESWQESLVCAENN